MSHSAALSVIKTHKTTGNADKTAAALDRKRIAAQIAADKPEKQAFETKPIAAEEVQVTKDKEPGLEETTDKAEAETKLCKERADEEQLSVRPRHRSSFALPGRPQLQKFNSQASRDAEYESKIEKFKVLHEEPQLNLRALKELSWSGIPRKMRAITWRLLSGYLPTSHERRDSILQHKRLSYFNLVEQYFKAESRDESQQDTFRQIHIDMPRMNPHIQLFQQTLVQEMFERILFIWAIRHPASGYVQGINDLVTPFFIVFLQEALGADDSGLNPFPNFVLSVAELARFS